MTRGPVVESGWRPGLVGEIVREIGRYCARDWGFGADFEAKVAHELGAFLARLDPARDRLFSVRDGDAFLGGLVIDGSDPALAPGEAHLRWFIVADAARGRGIGGALIDAATAFLDSTGYRSCYLTTFAGLDAARALYARAGFRLVAEADGATWGRKVREQRWERP